MNLSFVPTLLQFIIAFSVIAIIHELGHFTMAKAGKVEVEEFGLGLPPRALKMFKVRETLFSLNWIPSAHSFVLRVKMILQFPAVWQLQTPGTVWLCF
jgi:membrane-associated protease RseP (regulator of RpoE activity)